MSQKAKKFTAEDFVNDQYYYSRLSALYGVASNWYLLTSVVFVVGIPMAILNKRMAWFIIFVIGLLLFGIAELMSIRAKHFKNSYTPRINLND